MCIAPSITIRYHPATLLHPVFNPNYPFTHCVYQCTHYHLSSYFVDILVVISTLLASHCLQILLILPIISGLHSRASLRMYTLKIIRSYCTLLQLHILTENSNLTSKYTLSPIFICHWILKLYLHFCFSPGWVLLEKVLQ